MTASHVIVGLCVTLLIALTLIPAWRPSQILPNSSWLYAAVIFALLIAGHWPALQARGPWGNPDEAQMIAGAITLQHDPVFWRSVDGTTHGPFDIWPLVIANSFGLPLNFVGARWLAIICTAVTLITIGACLQEIYGPLVARMSLLPVAAMLSLTQEPEYLQYSSEHVPILFLAGAFYFGFSRPEMNSPWRATLVGALVVAAPLAKLQSALLAAGFGLFWLFSALGKSAHRVRLVLCAAGGGAVALTLAIGPALLNKAGHEFYLSYIAANIAYAADSNWVASNPRSVWGFSWLLLMTAVSTAFALIISASKFFTQQITWLAVATGVLAWISIYLPGRAFLHYWLLLVPGIQFGLAAAWSAILAQPNCARRRIAIILGAIGAVTPFATKHLTQSFTRWNDHISIPAKHSASAVISRLTQSSDAITVWGWCPQLYVLTHRRQATREAHTYYQIQAGPFLTHMRSRYLADLRNNPPAVFADAVGPGAFFFSDRPTQAHESFAELGRWIECNYKFIGDYDGVRIYLRRSQFSYRGTNSRAKRSPHCEPSVINHSIEPRDITNRHEGTLAAGLSMQTNIDSDNWFGTGAPTTKATA